MGIFPPFYKCIFVYNVLQRGKLITQLMTCFLKKKKKGFFIKLVHVVVAVTFLIPFLPFNLKYIQLTCK